MPLDTATAVTRVADVLADAAARGPVLTLTGAGVSTDSGIPDYRGPDGARRVTPMSHQTFVGSTEARRRYWARGFLGWARFHAAEPNPTHHAIAGLQRAGALADLITQNVDGLHQRAGSPDVIELHGSLADVVCLDCGARFDREAIQLIMADLNPRFADEVTALVGGSRVSSQIRPDGDVVVDERAVAGFRLPVCLRCDADTLKPDVVFFGGSVPKERVEHCYALTDAASSLLVLGSSLQVMSGYRFVRRAAARGVPVVIITRGPTRGDGEATLRIDAALAEVMPALAASLTPDGSAGR